MATLPDKQVVIAALRAELEGRIERAAARAEQTRADATHEEARAENDKDTRGLEQSYLARGQAQRAEELAEALHRVRLLSPRAYGEDDAIGLGALVRAMSLAYPSSRSSRCRTRGSGDARQSQR